MQKAKGKVQNSPPGVLPWRDPAFCTLHFAFCILFAFLLAGPANRLLAYTAITNKTDHTEIHVVPAPGKVTIDGDLKDWDLSGAILMFVDEASKGAYSVRGAMMHDADHLYIGGQVKDPTPMVNSYAFGGEVTMSWNADAIQIRLLADPAARSDASLQTGGHISPEANRAVNHITLWYSTRDGKAGYFACYGMNFADPTLNPPGVEGAYKKDADGKGYAFEYKVPWKVLRAPRPLQAGDKVQCQWQLHWGNSEGNAVRLGMTDVRNPEGSKDLGYMGPRSWGTAIFEKTGNIKLKEKSIVGRAPGHVPIAFRLDKPAKVSLAVCDAKGRLVRTCLGAQPYPAGEHVYLWDGLSDWDRPLPAGDYAFKMLTHDGVKQKLVCDVGVSGTPPYQTEDGTGGWAGDYNVPWYVAAEGGRVVLGTGGSEAAPTSIGTDLDGRKQWGAFVGHKGPLRLHGGFGYFVRTGSATLAKFDAAKGFLAPFSGGKPEVPIIEKKADDKDWTSRSWMWGGMAFLGDEILIANTFEGQIYRLDIASGAVKGAAPLEKVLGLATSPKGDLYAISGEAVGSYDLKSQRFRPIPKALDNPRHLAADKEGNLYVALQGAAMQVWKLSPRGRVLLKYGKPGGRPLVGRFDPGGMLNPYDGAVDANGRLWVAEADGQPKRYSVWNPDGTLWRDFFGSHDYASRAYLDPGRPEDIYVQAVRYKVDYEKGTWRPLATIARPAKNGDILFTPPGGHAGGSFASHGGRTFLWTREGQTLYEMVGDDFVPRMAWLKTKKGPVTYWLDDNNDGKVQPGEVRETGVYPPGANTGLWLGNVIDPKLNIYTDAGPRWHGQGGPWVPKPFKVFRWSFKGFNAQGGLVYDDPQQAAVAAADDQGGSVSCYQADAEGRVFVLLSGGSLQRGVRAQGTGHRVMAFGPDALPLWEYHNVHCAFAWTSDVYQPGDVVGALSFAEGSTPDLVAVTGYYGQYFLLDKRDGLFVDALGEDQRSAYTLDQHMVLTENFNGTLFRHAKNGKTYFIGGDADARLWELAGLDTMRRSGGKLVVTGPQATQSAKNALQAAEARAFALGKKTAKVVRLKGAAADGKYDEWAAAPALTIVTEEGRSAVAQLGYDDANLYARFQVAADAPLLNQAGDYKLLFKSGGAVELQLGTDLRERAVRGQGVHEVAVGDLRLIVARDHAGKMAATLYRPKTAEAAKPNKAEFTSPTGKETLDEVVPLNDLPMHCAADKEGYVVELAVPWAKLGVAPKSGLQLVGDVGVIFGNKGGTRNAIRHLWADRSPEVSINNDIPSESRIHPNDWGRLILE